LPADPIIAGDFNKEFDTLVIDETNGTDALVDCRTLFETVGTRCAFRRFLLSVA
jgi:hypothetical protein